MKTKLLLLLLAICKLISAQSITADFGSTTVCSNDSTCFYDSSTSNGALITSWHWSFGDGAQSVLQNPCHTYNLYGAYTAKLVVTNSNGDKDSVEHPVILYPSPVANFSSTTVCAGALTCFTDLSTIVSGSIVYWFWDFGNFHFSYQKNPCLTFIAAGNYNVTLIIHTEHLCKDTITLPVTVNDCTGMDIISKNETTKIFPNPFYTQTNIQADKVFKNAILTVYNSFGQQVKQIKNISGQKITFYRDNLPGGMYFIRLTQGNETVSSNILVISDK